MAWVASIAASTRLNVELAGPVDRWRQIRQTIHDEV
jgi:hypothetical protein